MLGNNNIAVLLMVAGFGSAMTLSENRPLNFAQISAEAGDDCCCSFMPCMPTCQKSCEPELPPVIEDELPPEIGESILNLDVLVTHIVHGMRNQDEDIPVPSDPEAEHEFIQNVIDPLIIKLFA